MPVFQKGDTVNVHYVGTLEDGSIFDSSEGKAPLSFVIGEELLIPKFENSVIGKKSGEIVELVLLPEDAYGERDENLIIEVEKSMFGDIENLAVGMPLSIETEDGPLEVFVAHIGEDSITIDGNHPLSGEKLHFTITIQ